MRSLLRGMMAVCGMGRFSGRRNSATTANQSANAPTVAASQNAPTQAQMPRSPLMWLTMKPASIASNMATAYSLRLRSCARRGSSWGLTAYSASFPLTARRKQWSPDGCAHSLARPACWPSALLVSNCAHSS